MYYKWIIDSFSLNQQFKQVENSKENNKQQNKWTFNIFEKDNENNHISEDENEMNEKTVNSNYSFDEMKLKI